MRVASLMVGRRSTNCGSAVIIVLILLSLMSALITSNMIALNRIKTELRLLEQKQVRRLNTAPPSERERPRPQNPPAAANGL